MASTVFGPPLSQAMQAEVDAYRHIDIPFELGFGLGVIAGFGPSSYRGLEGIAWRQYANGPSRDTRVPTFDIGVNPILGSAFSITAARQFIAAILRTHYLYLDEVALSDRDVLREQQIYWKSRGLTSSESVYLSKHNLNFVGNVDPARINTAAIKEELADFSLDHVVSDTLIEVVKTAVAAINTTELIRIVIHCADINCTEFFFMDIIQRCLDYILMWGCLCPGACRVEVVLKGEEQHKANIIKLITTPSVSAGDEVNAMRQSNWRLHETAAWMVNHAEDESHPDGALFVPLHTRFGIRYEVYSGKETVGKGLLLK